MGAEIVDEVGPRTTTLIAARAQTEYVMLFYSSK